ncbi:ABC transporter permease [Paenibacillus sp. OSY-SE]|uniref:ABC transporter permease n=1 Tax=Paenibacillus sp. OSY-SE TaxID=1196323 RepID=UPI0002D6F389|nr:ABC transporter permease subunit [Paenibacillus sp. OSY-SE]
MKKCNITLWIGGFMLAFLVFVMFFGPDLPFVDKGLQEVKHRWSEQKKLLLPPYAPSSINPLGSDRNGVDNLSKLIVGTKETILIVFFVAFLRYLIAIPLGLLARKKKGVAHFIVNSLNQLFSFMPSVFSAILLLSIPFIQYANNRLIWVIFFLAIIETGRVAHLVQEQTNKITREPFFEAGVGLGLSSWRLSKSYYFPALLPEIVVNFCLDLGKVMLLIGQLGVLSIFLTHDWVEVDYYTMKFLSTSLNWVSLLAEHRAEIYVSKFSFIFYPALAVAFSILTFNILGEGLRRHFNRRMNVYL